MAIIIFTLRVLDSQGCKVSYVDCDKTALIHRLISVFLGRTCQKVRLLTVGLTIVRHLLNAVVVLLLTPLRQTITTL